jgi:hypothetical protein
MFAVVFALAGCGGAASEAGTPAQPSVAPQGYPAPPQPSAAPTTLGAFGGTADGLTEEVARASRDLDALLETKKDETALGGGCVTACAALIGLRSATDRLCALAGEPDPRCVDARARVQQRSARVAAACGDCVK